MYPDRDFEHVSSTAPSHPVSATELLAEDSPVARTQLYLRLLYSEDAVHRVRAELDNRAAVVAAETRRLLAGIDWTGLAVEQNARRRNLYSQLLGRSPLLVGAIEQSELRRALFDFIDMTEFWMPRGRTLLENFAFTMQGRFREDGKSFDADVLVLAGMISGVHSGSDFPSPWVETSALGAARISMDGATHTETFLSDFRLLDAHGDLPNRSNLDEVRTPGRRRIVVSRRDNGSVIVFSLKT